METIRLICRASLGLVAMLVATNAVAVPVCGREVASFGQIESDLARDPKLKPIPNGGPDFVAYGEENPTRQWFLTKPGYPAVQAVICRALQQDDGRFFIKTESHCFGPKATCDALVAAFQQPSR